ncbi:CreA family protein [Indioceanicola profundi]|uniref:CreA family protein n=1 Tax=Indioceanicola profundi TaxID=2220096 RepID=UPI000E6A9F4A|nr:CreA family protein [Indioceanicola profundi]
MHLVKTAAALVSACLLAFSAAVPAAAQEEVGEFSNDWTGNELKVIAMEDPEVDGVTCHIVHFDRSVIDRLRKGNWFEDPSNASIACRQTGPIVIGDIETGKSGEEVFSERKSLVFKALAVRRIYDKTNDTLVYVIYSRQVTEASAKMAISSVPLFAAQPTWKNGKPS